MSTELRYVWTATYKDGTTFSQYDSENKEQLFGDIDQDRLDSFSFTSNTGHTLKVKIKEGMRLICFRRHTLRQFTIDTMVYILGYQKTINNTNVKSMMIIDDNGDVTLVDGDI